MSQPAGGWRGDLMLCRSSFNRKTYTSEELLLCLRRRLQCQYHRIANLTMPRSVEAIDGLFIRRIEEILAGMHDWRFRHSTREAIDHATQMLALFRDNANLGKGIGIDEYESTPPAGKKAPGKPTHNTVLVRGLILDHLRDELQTDRKDVSSALKALRLSTRQALHEGWLAA